MSSWSNYVSEEQLTAALSEHNSNVGPARQVEFMHLEELASRAATKYAYLSEEERTNAILWDATGFLEYATVGVTASAEFYDNYSDLLPEGHPHNAGESLVASAAWAAGAPELEESQRDAIVASLISDEDEVVHLHATTRLNYLVASGALTEETTELVKRLEAQRNFAS